MSETSSSDDEQGNFTKNFQTAVESKNHWDRIRAITRVHSILSIPYVHENKPIDMLDKKLVKGFYNRSLNEYKYLNTEPNIQKSPTKKVMNSSSSESSQSLSSDSNGSM